MVSPECKYGVPGIYGIYAGRKHGTFKNLELKIEKSFQANSDLLCSIFGQFLMVWIISRT